MKNNGVENGNKPDENKACVEFSVQFFLQLWIVAFIVVTSLVFQKPVHASVETGDSKDPCVSMIKSFAELQDEWRIDYETLQTRAHRGWVTHRLITAWNGGSRIPELTGMIKADVVTAMVNGEKVETLSLRHAIQHSPGANVQGNTLLLHGFDAGFRELSSMAPLLHLLSREKMGDKESIAKIVQGMKDYRLLTGEAIAMPGHDGGPALMSVHDTLSFLAAHIQRIKTKNPLLPFYLITESGSGNVVAQLLSDKSFAHIADLVDGVIMMNPPWAGDPKVVDGALEHMKSLVEYEVQRGMDRVAYPQLLDRDRENRIANDWAQENFAGKPVLILRDQNHPSATVEEGTLFRELDERLPNVQVVNIQNVGPETFREGNPDQNQGAIASLMKMYEFLRSHQE